MCVTTPCICEVDGYNGIDTTQVNLTGLALERAKQFYSDKQLSTTRISSIVRLDYGQYGDIGTLEPCTKVYTCM